MTGDRPSLRVGVNLLWLVPGVVGGSEDYAVGLLTALADAPGRHDRADGVPPVDLVVFVNRRFADAYPGLCAAFDTVVAPFDGSSRGRRVLGESTWLPRQVRRRRVEVLHHFGGLVPFNDGAGSGAVPGRRGCVRVLTVHDLQPLDIPANFSVVKRIFERVAIPWSVRRADVIVTLGTHVATTVHDRFGTSPRRFALVAPGAQRPAAQSATADRSATSVDTSGVADRLGLAGHPYFLYPAITYPHKNHVVLVEAMARLKRTHPDVRLVLTGGAAGAEADLDATVQRCGVGEVVLRPGRVSSDDLGALYAGATAVVFPSRYEGFGLPVLEAMRLGCPVIAANTTALPSVVGGAGILVPPDDVDEWVRAMVLMCDDPVERRRHVAAGRERAAGFTWESSARALVGVWRRAAAAAGVGPDVNEGRT